MLSELRETLPATNVPHLWPHPNLLPTCINSSLHPVSWPRIRQRLPSRQGKKRAGAYRERRDRPPTNLTAISVATCLLVPDPHEHRPKDAL